MTRPVSEETIEQLFEHSIEIEYKAAHIYETFSKLFSHIPELTGFWQGLIEDEKSHPTMLEEIRNMLTPEQLVSRTDRKMQDAVAGIQRRLSRDLAGAIKTLDDAYELAHELEFSEVNAIFLLLTAKYVPSHERRQFVRSRTQKHQEKLLDFNRVFGGRDWRKGIEIRRI